MLRRVVDRALGRDAQAASTEGAGVQAQIDELRRAVRALEQEVASLRTARAAPSPPLAGTRISDAIAGVAREAPRDAARAAPDGAPRGPADNASARARARGEVLVVDQAECISCGTCVESTDAVFVLPGDQKAVVVRQDGPMDLIQDAIDACPVACIHWTDDPEKYPQVNDASGNPVAPEPG